MGSPKSVLGSGSHKGGVIPNGGGRAGLLQLDLHLEQERTPRLAMRSSASDRVTPPPNASCMTQVERPKLGQLISHNVHLNQGAKPDLDSLGADLQPHTFVVGEIEHDETDVGDVSLVSGPRVGDISQLHSHGSRLQDSPRRTHIIARQIHRAHGDGLAYRQRRAAAAVRTAQRQPIGQARAQFGFLARCDIHRQADPGLRRLGRKPQHLAEEGVHSQDVQARLQTVYSRRRQPGGEHVNGSRARATHPVPP